jgi:hypothetical protein
MSRPEFTYRFAVIPPTREGCERLKGNLGGAACWFHFFPSISAAGSA